MSASPGAFFLSTITPPRADLHAAPGQFLLAVPPSFDSYLPRVVWPFHLSGNRVDSILLPPGAASWATSEQLVLRGPYGRAFVLPDRPLRTLVLAADTLGGAQLLPLVEALVARECEVTVLCEPSQWIERWLPSEVEYRGAEPLIPAAADLWNWADALYACGDSAFYDGLASAAREGRLRLDSGWGQLLIRDLPMPCGTGVCYLCATKSRRGFMLNCQEGPVLDLADWLRGE